MGHILSCIASKFKKTQNMHLTDLPDEVLVEVAQNLDYESLCELMMVNRRFLELVHGNRRLWNKFRLNIVGPRCHFNMPSAKRRFDSVDVRYVNCNKGLVLNFATDMKQIKLSYCISSQVEIVEFLQTMPNLEQIKMYDQRFINYDNDAVQPHNLPEFEKLTDLVYLSKVGLQIFTNAKNLRKLSCDSVSPDFLIKQKNLVDLNIDFDRKKSSIFSEDFTGQVKFRLETLAVGNAGTKNDDVDVEGKLKVLAKFINLHQHHLKDLHIWETIQTTPLKSFLINLKFLQRLNLCLYEDGFEVDPELISQMKATKLPVEDLKLTLSNSFFWSEKWNVQLLGEFIECFPNVINLSLSFDLTFKNDSQLMISKEFNPKLVRLAIDFYRNSNIVNHLKFVELDDVMLSFENFISYPKQWCQFAINNPNIRDLKISANNLTDDTLKELIPLKELRYLEIECAEDNQFLSVTFENLFENCKKLVEFKLDDLYYSSSVSPDLDDDSDYPDEFFDSE